MRTFDEINSDLRKFKNDKEKVRELKEEKEEVWNTLFEGHRNYNI